MSQLGSEWVSDKHSQTVANIILSININNSNNFNSLVSQSVESVSELVTKVDNDQTQVYWTAVSKLVSQWVS